MLRDRAGRARLDVARRAHLQRDPLVPDVAGELAERGPTGRVDRDVVDDPHAVAEPVGVALLQRLPDRRQPEGLPGVDRVVAALPLHVLEGREVSGGRVARLRPGDVEADDALVTEGHRQLGDLERARGVPHRCQQRDDADRPVGAALAEALLHGLHHLGQRQVALQVQLGREADLGVDDAVVGQVLRALAGDPHKRVVGLHHPDGVRERRQVARQRPGVRVLLEPPPELLDVGRGQAVVTGLGRQLDDRRRAQPAVEVVVQQHLRRAPHVRGAGQAGHSCSRFTLSGEKAGRQTATYSAPSGVV